jgi:hypothetical protein
MNADLIEINRKQIDIAKSYRVLRKLAEDGHILSRIRKAEKVIVNFCSDGRYTADILRFITSKTGVDKIHIFGGHGGALTLASSCSLHGANSAALRDTRLKELAAAHLNMDYDVLVNIIHGPECKAMIGSEMDINHAFDHYALVPGETRRVLPRLEEFNLFHYDRGHKLCLYEFIAENWKLLRQSFPEPIWLPEDSMQSVSSN